MPKKRTTNPFGASFIDLLAGALGAVLILYIIVPKLTAEQASVMEDLQRINIEIEDIQNLIDSFEGTVPEQLFEEVQQRLNDLENSMAHLREQIEILMQELHDERKAGEQLAAQLEEMQQQLSEAQAERDQMQAALHGLETRPIDVVIVMDITASMGPAVNGLKREILDIVRLLDHLFPSVGIGIVAYGDIRYSRPVTPFNIADTSVPREKAALLRFINSMELEMGIGSGINPEKPEALHLALPRAIEMNWRPVAEERYIVIVTDAPAYPNQMANIDRMVSAFAADPANQISTVQVRDPMVFEAAQTMLKRIARLGNGTYTDTSTGESFMTALLLSVLSPAAAPL